MSTKGPSGPSMNQSALSMSTARASVLEAVRQRGRLCTVREIARDFDLHPNTVREHLDALLEQGLVAREASSPTGRGRPALMYRPTSASQDVARDYELLSDVLAEQLAAMPNARETALAAGRSWGNRTVTERDGDVRIEELPGVIGRLGFEPTLPDVDGNLVLRSCPILAAARRHPEVVCTVHLGYVQALIEAAGEDPTTTRLVPMGDEHGCLLHVEALAARRPDTAAS
ncbi:MULTISPECIES: helix-turn-helix transcriptional regulator [unclassified Luteococcus]|uniref:helix-turn-helix transcriptional regulator n=1 Tax=unclassified Luteococcus TaxID=2639923 RepID=UPI00313F0E94